MREGEGTYWYNPTTRVTGSRPAPETAAEALALPGGDLDTDFFVAGYGELRASGRGVEEALILTSHGFRLGHLEFRAAR